MGVVFFVFLGERCGGRGGERVGEIAPFIGFVVWFPSVGDTDGIGAAGASRDASRLVVGDFDGNAAAWASEADRHRSARPLELANRSVWTLSHVISVYRFCDTGPAMSSVLFAREHSVLRNEQPQR